MFVCGNAEKNSHFNVTFKVVNFENALKWMQNLEKVKLFLNKWSNKWGNMKANKKKSEKDVFWFVKHMKFCQQSG